VVIILLCRLKSLGYLILEREMVANIVKYNYIDFGYYEEVGKYASIDKESYLKIAKLTALIRVGSGLDRSHKQKFEMLQAQLQLRISCL
jgi:exopolyphosphatase / guanosine-5'-triphosphate,3'-diphosphate pyrophosphatase